MRKPEEAAATLNCCSEKASKLFKELDDVNGIGLITRKRRGLGKPSIIYVKNFIIDENPDDSDSKNSRDEESRSQDKGISELQSTENPVSCAEENRVLEPDNSEAIKNNIIKTDISNTEYQSYRSVGGCERDEATAIVNDNISYDIITESNSSIADMITEIRNIMVDVICGDRQVIIRGKVVPAETAKSTFMKLNDEHIIYVIDNISKLEGKIQRPDKYICTALYNAAYTCNISLFTGFTAHTGMPLTAGA